MILFVVMIGIAAVAVTAAVVDDDKDEIESLRVSEGGNITISINNKDEDPQVWVSRLKGFSHQLIAQIICHNRVCESEYWISGVSLMSDGGNVTLILMNVSYNQTGRYAVQKLSGTQLENKSYIITVNHPRLSTIGPELLPSVTHSKSFTAGVTSAAVCLILLITAAIIGVVYRKRRKANFYKVSQDDDTAANSLCGSLNVIDI